MKNQAIENRAEFAKCIARMRFLNDNLCLARLGATEGDGFVDPEIVSSGLYLIGLELEELIEKLENLNKEFKKELAKC